MMHWHNLKWIAPSFQKGKLFFHKELLMIGVLKERNVFPSREQERSQRHTTEGETREIQMTKII
jgi:hypothetical protein